MTPPDAPAQLTGATLDSMPAKLTIEILGHLRPRDLTKLARTSKKYRDAAQSVLWRNIELHRRDAHDGHWGVLDRESVSRAFLDDIWRHPWSGSVYELVIEQNDARFNSVLKRKYQSAGMSQGWKRLAGFLRSLCLTVTAISSPRIWDMILSLPNLDRLEVVGEHT